MNTGELLKYVDIPRHKLYYLEQKGYITPKKIVVGDKEFRNYSPDEVRKIKLLWKYLKAGFKYKVAYHKAMAELSESKQAALRLSEANPGKEEDQEP